MNGAARMREAVNAAQAAQCPVTHARRANPFDSELARLHGNYAAMHDGRLVRVAAPTTPVTDAARRMHDDFRALVLDPRFSCLGAKAAVSRGAYRTGLYDELGSAAATAGLARDLFSFVEDRYDLAGGFSTFVAGFRGPPALDEAGFERLLWQQLQGLHDEDRRFHGWDPSVSADPESAEFSFSFAGRAFFVVGLHPASSRIARRFAWPALAFNAHEQFDQLRVRGRFDKMRTLIRERDQALQGSLNPNLSDFGERSEARQYSGRAVGDAWRCPFQAHAESPSWVAPTTADDLLIPLPPAACPDVPGG